MAGTSEQRQRQRQRRPGDLGVAYGLIAGGGVGTMLFALTTEVMWIWIGPGVGLLIGLLVASALAQRDQGQQDR